MMALLEPLEPLDKVKHKIGACRRKFYHTTRLIHARA